MSGVFGHRLGRKYSQVFARVVQRQLAEILGQLLFRVAPGEIGIGLGEAQLGQPMHDFRTGEGLGKKNDVGEFGLDPADQPLPEAERLGVRIVDPENAHPLADPEIDDALEFAPQPLPVFALEIEGIDILVFLGRIFGVLDAAVRTMPEPLRMLAHVRMVRRTLESDVQGDRDSLFARRAHQPAEILAASQPGMDFAVSAVGRADGPETAGIAGSGVETIVAPLAESLADRMDRRQIEHVEAHRRDTGQPLDDGGQGSVLAVSCSAGTGKQFVPGGKTGTPDIDDRLQDRIGLRDEMALGMLRHQRHQTFAVRQFASAFGNVRLAQLGGPFLQVKGVVAVGTGGGGAHQRDGNVLRTHRRAMSRRQLRKRSTQAITVY